MICLNIFTFIVGEGLQNCHTIDLPRQMTVLYTETELFQCYGAFVSSGIARVYNLCSRSHKSCVFIPGASERVHVQRDNSTISLRVFPEDVN